MRTESEKHRIAYAYWAGLGPRRRLTTVAKHFGLSVRTLKYWCSAFEWKRRLQSDLGDNRALANLPAFESRALNRFIDRKGVRNYYDGWRDGFQAAWSASSGFGIEWAQLKEHSALRSGLTEFVKSISKAERKRG